MPRHTDMMRAAECPIRFSRILAVNVNLVTSTDQKVLTVQGADSDADTNPESSELLRICPKRSALRLLKPQS